MSRLVTPDLCVIGAGSGGLTVAAGAAQLGASVVLVEGDRMGGDCLNHGCVPSKSLLAAARHAEAMRSGAAFGIAPVEPAIDFAAVKDHVERVIAAIAPHDSVERFEGLGVTVIRDWARFVSPRRVEAGGTAIEARRFVIATGSRPALPPLPGIEGFAVLTNETIFGLRERPRHLVILGGGPVGVEMAQAHRRLGCAVTLVEGARLLGREDPELVAIVARRLAEEGVRILEGRPAEQVAAADGGVALRVGGETVTGTHLLVATGRRASLGRLDLDRGGIEADAASIRVDAGLRSVSNRRVYAIGDAAGGMQFTHLAGYHGSLVIRNALFGLPVRARMDHIPRVTFTDPELAQVGMTEAEARAAHGDRIEILHAAYDGNDRARTERATDGLAKIVVLRGRPVGAGIVGAQAGELIGLWSLAIANRMKIGQIATMVAPYPTLGEIAKRAAGDYYARRLFGNSRVRRLVHLVQRWLP
jgi:pyruvate/2-oxoglutarate dehydrogenase complex dihydrolipoamide dehydrogenase (E3) component